MAKKKRQRVYLDMDGTIFELYHREDWLERLENGDESVFWGDFRIITENDLKFFYPASEFEIIILSMTPKGADDDFCKRVEEVKNRWLDLYFPSITKRIYRKYGHNKNLKGSANAILIDDNAEIRKTWKGVAINPAEIWG